jgi:hypothetical protein
MTAPSPDPAPFRSAREKAFVARLPGTAVVDVDGTDAAAFLQSQLSSDVAALAPGAAQWSTYNSPKGRMLATLLVWRPTAGPAMRLALSADLADPIRKRLSMFVLRSKVTLGSGDVGVFGVGGPEAIAAVRATLGVEAAPLRATAFGDGDEVIGLPDGRVLVVARRPSSEAIHARLATVATPADESVWRWLAIRAGIADVRLATQDRHVAQTANWDATGGVSFTKGCYPGQEIVARTQHLGILKERAHPFHVAAPPPAPATPIYSHVFGEQACGSVLDAVAMPDGGSDLIAVVQSKAVDEGDLRLGSPGGPALDRLALPYALPASAPKRVRL